MSDSILVTGASGFVGGKVFQRLKDDGITVLGIGRRNLELPDYESIDLTRRLPTITQSCNAVIHAAARSSPWGSRREFARQNIEVTRRLLDACERSGKPRFVYISSSSVYYRAEHQFDITEETVQANPACNHYAWSKQQAEELVRKYDGPWVIIRPRAVFGPGDTVLFPRIVTAAAAGKLPILMNKDQAAIGDLIYIDNLSEVIVRAAMDPGVAGEFNVTNNRPIELIATLLKILGKLGFPTPTRKVPVSRALKAATMIELFHKWVLPFREPPITRFGIEVFAYSKTFDVSKMLDTFGPPAVSFDQGVDRFVEWIQNEQPYKNQV